MSGEGRKILILVELLGQKRYIRGCFGSSLKRGEVKGDGIPPLCLIPSAKEIFSVGENTIDARKCFIMGTNR
jgi:hypothetical protein